MVLNGRDILENDGVSSRKYHLRTAYIGVRSSAAAKETLTPDVAQSGKSRDAHWPAARSIVFGQGAAYIDNVWIRGA